MIIFGIDIRIYFLLFMTYAILGWCMEVTCKLIQYKRFINRGFLIGPYCPIYGYGAILITFLLKKYTNDPIVLFFMAIIICGTLEYLTSYFMEKIFKARWWDYSQKKFNINGRVCLNTIIPFGILGLFIMYVSNPFLLEKISLLPEVWLNILFWSLLIIYIVDNIVSGIVIRYVKKTEKIVGKDLDNTEEITKKVMSAVTDPGRIRKDDKGKPDVCMVYYYHKLFSSEDEVNTVCSECKAGARGCVACKRQLAKNISDTLKPIREKRAYYEEHPEIVDKILMEGTLKAQKTAKETMKKVKKAMRLDY